MTYKTFMATNFKWLGCSLLLLSKS